MIEQVNGQSQQEPILFIIHYDPQTQGTGYGIRGKFPLPALVNALSLAHADFVGQQLALAKFTTKEQQGPQVVGPDGQPLPRDR